MSTSWVCLMYHDITPAMAASGGGPARFSVPVEAFRMQLDQLAASGYAVRSLRRLLADPGPRGIAITFDDGDHGQFERGFRALAERGMSATFFVTTDWIGKPGYASLAQLREMRAAGMDVQSHTRSHPFLAELDATALSAELVESKRALDDGLEQDTDMLALPGGAWPRRPLRHLIARAGYAVVATSVWGVNTGHDTAGAPTAVRRCTIAGEPEPEHFARIAAGDRWLGMRRQLRERALGAMRSALGPSRYATLRRAFLDTIEGRTR